MIKKGKSDPIVVDCSGKLIGHVSNEIAKIALEKDNVNYNPSVPSKRQLEVINAGKISFNDNKKNMTYRFKSHSGFPGMIYKKIQHYVDNRIVWRLLKHCVKTQLPSNARAKHILTNIKFYEFTN